MMDDGTGDDDIDEVAYLEWKEVNVRETPSQEARLLNQKVDSRDVRTVDGGWTKTDHGIVAEIFHF